MAHSKSKKKIKFSKDIPNAKNVRRLKEPNSENKGNPVWKFSYRDKEKWSFTSSNLHSDVLEYLSLLENQTWNEILVENKKKNHSINVETLNKCARDRLSELNIEASSIISLRINAKHRLYGYKVDNVFHIVWYDTEHGNNTYCVCRSRLKHT